MILLAATVPVTPFAAWIFPSLALSTLVNAGAIALIVPAAHLIRNTVRKEKAPFRLRYSGCTPVPGNDPTRHFGFVTEEITDGDPISRNFLPAASSIRALRKNSALSIRKLRESPEKFAKELDLYRRSGRRLDHLRRSLYDPDHPRPPPRACRTQSVGCHSASSHVNSVV